MAAFCPPRWGLINALSGIEDRYSTVLSMLSFRLPALYIVSNLMGYNAFLIPYSLAQAIPCIIWAPYPLDSRSSRMSAKKGQKRRKWWRGFSPWSPGLKLARVRWITQVLSSPLIPPAGLPARAINDRCRRPDTGALSRGIGTDSPRKSMDSRARATALCSGPAARIQLVDPEEIILDWFCHRVLLVLSLFG